MLLLSVLGCTRAVSSVVLLPDKAAHYLLIDEEDGEAWDCYSRPDGSAWNPTCLKVDYQNEADDE